LEVSVAEESQHELSFSYVVSQARTYFEASGYQVYDIFPDDPGLPVDLYCEGGVIPLRRGETGEKERRDRVFVLVCLMPTIPWQERLLSYQYYLSKYLSPIEYKMVLVVPYDSKLEKEKLYQEYGFGLYKVQKSGEIEELYKPLTLRDRMIRNFEASDIASNDDSLKEKSHEIARFFDEYIHEFADILSPEAERRHIDRIVLDKILELKQVRCKDKLLQLVNNHLSDKGKSEYDFCMDVTECLWSNYVGMPYADVLSLFEPILSKIVPQGRYRDHVLHQFQVFLSGICVIDRFYDKFSAKYKDPELSWLIAATSHDLAYPIQYYNEWSGKFFTQLFNTKENMGALELKSHFIDESFLACLGDLIGLFKKLHFDEDLTADWLAKDNDLVKFFHKQATEQRNHGVLQAFSLLKNQKSVDNKEVFIPSALSVLLHHGIWKELKKDTILPRLRFVKDPLSFLLIFCDTVQEWGRPKLGEQLQEGINSDNEAFFLKEFICAPDDKRVEVRIWTPRHLNNDPLFVRKHNEIREVSAFLEQDPEIKFLIVLEDKHGHSHPYEMTGPS